MSVQPVAVVNTTLDPEKQQMQPVEMALRAQPNSSGTRDYVGDAQEVTLTFPQGWPAQQVLTVVVALDHIPTDAQPRSGVKAEEGADGSAQVWEVHDDSHVWTQTRVYFAADTNGPLTQKWLIL